MAPQTISRNILKIDPAVEADRIQVAIRDIIFNQLKRKGVVVGVSGGIDSSVVVSLCARALGKDRVLAMFTPEIESAGDSLHLGRMLAQGLGVRSVTEDITPMLKAARCYERRDAAVRTVVPEYGDGYKCKIVIPPGSKGSYPIFSVVVQSPAGETKKVRRGRSCCFFSANLDKARSASMPELLNSCRDA